MTADCMVCRGACCEDLVFPVKGLSALTVEFLRTRCGGEVRLTAREEGFAFPVRCPYLGEDGLCQIYERRPRICSLYEAGGEACVEIVRRRRTAEQGREILR